MSPYRDVDVGVLVAKGLQAMARGFASIVEQAALQAQLKAPKRRLTVFDQSSIPYLARLAFEGLEGYSLAVWRDERCREHVYEVRKAGRDARRFAIDDCLGAWLSTGELVERIVSLILQEVRFIEAEGP